MELVLRKKLFFFLVSGGIILGSDQLSKILIRLNGGFYICNPFVAFSLKIPEVLFWIFWFGIIFFILYLLYEKYLPSDSLCLIFILFGAFSNLIDRIGRGCIIDFIQLGWGPIFNLADSFITLGAIMLIWKHLKIKR